jgi:hypothetical protein
MQIVPEIRSKGIVPLRAARVRPDWPPYATPLASTLTVFAAHVPTLRNVRQQDKHQTIFIPNGREDRPTQLLVPTVVEPPPNGVKPSLCPEGTAKPRGGPGGKPDPHRCLRLDRLLPHGDSLGAYRAAVDEKSTGRLDLAATAMAAGDTTPGIGRARRRDRDCKRDGFDSVPPAPTIWRHGLASRRAIQNEPACGASLPPSVSRRPLLAGPPSLTAAPGPPRTVGRRPIRRSWSHSDPLLIFY